MMKALLLSTRMINAGNVIRITTDRDLDPNDDTEVDILDLVNVAQEYGLKTTVFDLNCDGIVNLYDPVLIASRIGQ